MNKKTSVKDPGKTSVLWLPNYLNIRPGLEESGRIYYNPVFDTLKKNKQP